MKQHIRILTFTVLCVLLCGCEGTSGKTELPTVIPAQTEPAPSVSTAASEATATTKNDFVEIIRSVGHGVDKRRAQYVQKEEGKCLSYDGREMELPYFIEADGPEYRCVGIVLFVDGMPQPYKTLQDPTYRYVHFFSCHRDLYTYSEVFSFIPVTGKKGDLIEVSTFSLLQPDYSVSDGNTGMVYAQGTTSTDFYISFNADPPEAPYDPVSEECTVLTKDTSKVDTNGWSAEDLGNRNAFRSSSSLDGRDGKYIYGVTPETEVVYRAEVWGSPLVNYRVVFFADNKPIRCVPVSVEQGKTTVVEALVLLPDFDGEAIACAFLLPRNAIQSGTTGCLPLAGSTTFLLAPKE